MNFILFDDERIHAFLPLTHTRPVCEIRCGIMTIHEKWEALLTLPVSYKTLPHLNEKFPLTMAQDNVLINGALFPTREAVDAVLSLKIGECLVYENGLLAVRLRAEDMPAFNIQDTLVNFKPVQLNTPPMMLNHLWDIFSMNDQAIRDDFAQLTRGKSSQPVSSTNQVIGNQLFIEPGAKVECSIINTESGPVYIGRDAEVMEGCIIRGPFALGAHGVLKMGAKIYGATTIGEGCKVGGEVNNSVFLSNSNKAHDGFIGNSVIGEWCNLGADTNNSNLKNNYEPVRLWSESRKSFIKTGLQFCGLIMGDHSKCGINTMFNTGTVVGFSCNIYGAGFPRNFIPSFSWGSANGFMEYQLEKAIDTASRVFARRNIPFNDVERKLFTHIFNVTQDQRNYNG
ncbi:MAG: GlmU family protein [Chitinophagaceae bacterium]|nr:GlmU family protein [Chitinophagaceae bacterium]